MLVDRVKRMLNKLSGQPSPAGAAAAPGPDGATSDQPEDRGSIARRIGRNVGIVVTGNAAAAAFGFITLALNARALGAAGLGVLALIMTTATLIDRIAAFQTSLPLIKLGADALAAGDKRRIRQLVTVALLFDAMSATAAAVTAVVIVLLAGERLGIPQEYLGLAAIYMATLVTRIADAPIGIMRLFDRFGLLTTLRAFEPAGQCLAAAFLFALGAPLDAYVLIFAGIAIATNITLFASGLHVAARNGVAPVVHGARKAWATEWRQFWTFSWLMSLMGTLNVVRDRAPVLLIGALLGPGTVGVYHVAERIADVLALVMWPFSLALYPEAARLATTRRLADLKWFVLRIGVVSGAIALAMLVGAATVGEFVILMVGGAGYGQAYWPVIMLIIGYNFAMVGIGLHSAILVTAGPKALFMATLVPFVIYAVVLVPAIAQASLLGAAAAQILFYSVWLFVSSTMFSNYVVKWRHNEPV